MANKLSSVYTNDDRMGERSVAIATQQHDKPPIHHDDSGQTSVNDASTNITDSNTQNKDDNVEQEHNEEQRNWSNKTTSDLLF